MNNLDTNTAVPVEEKGQGVQIQDDFDHSTAMPVNTPKDLPVTYHINNAIKEFATMSPEYFGLKTGIEVSQHVAKYLPEAMKMAFPREGQPLSSEDFESQQDTIGLFKHALAKVMLPTMTEQGRRFVENRPLTSAGMMLKGIPVVAAMEFAKGMAAVPAEEKDIGKILKGGVHGLLYGSQPLAESLVKAYDIKDDFTAGAIALLSTAMEAEVYTGIGRMAWEEATFASRRQFLATLKEGLMKNPDQDVNTIMEKYGLTLEQAAEERAKFLYRDIGVNNKSPLSIMSNIGRVRRLYNLDPLTPEVMFESTLVPGAARYFDNVAFETAKQIMAGVPDVLLTEETLEKALIGMSSKIGLPVVKVGDELTTGATHEDALNKVGMTKDKHKEGVDFQAGFLEGNKFITRDQAKKYGVSTSEELHDRAANYIVETKSPITLSNLIDKGLVDYPELYKKLHNVVKGVFRTASPDLIDEATNEALMIALNKRFNSEIIGRGGINAWIHSNIRYWAIDAMRRVGKGFRNISLDQMEEVQGPFADLSKGQQSDVEQIISEAINTSDTAKQATEKINEYFELQGIHTRASEKDVRRWWSKTSEKGEPLKRDMAANAAKARERYYRLKGEQPSAGGLPADPEIAKYLKDKNLTITGRDNIIRLKQDINVRDVKGNMHKLEAKNEYTPYKLSNGQILLKDGDSLIVSPGKLEDVKAVGHVLGKTGFSEPEGVEILNKTEAQNRRYMERLKDNVANEMYGKPFDELTIGQQHNVNSEVNIALVNEPGVEPPVQFAQYQLPGGAGYREHVVRMVQTSAKNLISDAIDQAEKNKDEEVIILLKRLEHLEELKSSSIFQQGGHDLINGLNHARQISPNEVPPGDDGKYMTDAGVDRARQYLGGLDALMALYYRSSHYGYGALGWQRANIRYTTDGEKVYFVEELQDVGSEGLEGKAFVERFGRNKLKELQLKQIILNAINEGCDYVAWTTGAQQARRYDLSKQVDKIIVEELTDGTYNVAVRPKGQSDYKIVGTWEPKDKLSSIVGKDIAKKVAEGKNKEGNMHRFSGVDLEIGGEWAKSLYDIQIPKILKDLTKKIGGEITTVDVSVAVPTKAGRMTPDEVATYQKSGRMIQQALKLTPELKAALTTGEQPMAGGLPTDKQKSIQKRLDLIYAEQAKIEESFLKRMKGKDESTADEEWANNEGIKYSELQEQADKLEGSLKGKAPSKGIKSTALRRPKTITGLIKSRGGIDFSKDYNVKEMREFGLTNTSGARTPDDWAKTFVEEGLIQIPENMNPGDYLIELLKNKEGRKIVDMFSDVYYEREYKKYVKETAEEEGVEFDVEKLEKQVASDNQKYINSLMRAAGKSAVLSPGKVKKIIREETGLIKYGDMVTEEDALKAQLKAEAKGAKKGYEIGKAEERLRARIRADVKREISSLLRDIKSLPTKRLPIEYKEQIEAIKSQYDLSKRTTKTLAQRESTKAFVQRMKEQGEPINIPEEELSMLDRIPLNDLTLDDLREIHNTVMRLYHLGSLKNKLLVAQADREYEDVVKEALNNITEGKGLAEEHSVIKALKTENPDAAKYVGQKIFDYIAMHLRPEIMWNSLDGFDQGINTRIGWDPMNRAEYVKIDGVKAGIDKVKEIFGKINWQSFVSKKYNIGRFKDMTMNNALHIYANSFNPYNLAHLAGSGLTDEDLAAIEKAIPENLKKAAKELIAWYDEVQYPSIDAIYAEIEGVHLPKQENYFPIDYLEDITYDKEIEKYILQKNYLRRPGVEKGFTKERVSSDKGFQKFSFIDTVVRNLNKVEHYKAFAREVRDLNKFLSDPRIRHAIQENFGDKYYNILQKWMKDVAYGGNRQMLSAVDQVARFLRVNYGIFALGLNLRTVGKQAVGLLQGIGYVGEANGIMGCAEYLVNPFKANDFVKEKSPLMKNRQMRQEREFQDMIAKRSAAAKVGKAGKLDVLQQATVAPIYLVDRAVANCVWLGGYRGKIRDGMSEEEACAFADRAVRRTQPMGGYIHLPDIFRGNEFMKQFTIFKGHVNKFFNLEYETIMRKAKGKDSWPEFYRKLFWFLLLPAYAIGSIDRQRLSRNAGEFIGDIAIQASNSLFLTEEIVKALATGYMPRTPMEEFTTDIEGTIKAKKPEVKADRAARLISAFTGIPYIGIKRIIKGKPFGEPVGGKHKKVNTENIDRVLQEQFR